MISHVRNTWIVFLYLIMILNIVQSDHQLDKSHISGAETEDTFLGEMEHLSQGPRESPLTSTIYI